VKEDYFQHNEKDRYFQNPSQQLNLSSLVFWPVTIVTGM